MQSSQDDTMRQANAMKSEYEKTIREFESDPAKATGMSKEEIEKRRAAAAQARSVNIGDKTFNIQSTARAQQIMQKGTNQMHLNKRMEEVKKNMGVLTTIRWVSIGVSAIAIGMISYTFLMPIYIAQHERQKRQEIRQKRAFYAHEMREREQRLRDQQAGGGAGGEGKQ